MTYEGVAATFVIVGIVGLVTIIGLVAFVGIGALVDWLRDDSWE